MARFPERMGDPHECGVPLRVQAVAQDTPGPLTVAVVVPWRGGCEHREAAWAWARERYHAHHPDWLVLAAPGRDPWVKAQAVMPAIAVVDADIIVVADADVWCDELAPAVAAAAAGAPWVIPHQRVRRLTRDATARVLAGADPADVDELEERAREGGYLGVEGGGIVIGHRALLEHVPMDPRFIGWGQEDESWARALRALLGPPERLTAPLHHLWHPPQPRVTRRHGSDENWRLARRYVRAAHDERAMRELLAEIPDEASEAAA